MIQRRRRYFVDGLVLVAALLSSSTAIAQTPEVEPSLEAPPKTLPASEVTPPPPRESRWELQTTLAATLSTTNYPDGQSSSGRGASANLEALLFLTPVIDDDAPRSLQPFLQRTSDVFVSVGGDVGDTQNPAGGAAQTNSNAAPLLGFAGYLNRLVYVDGSFGYSYSVENNTGVTEKIQNFSGSLGLGVRFGDARVSAYYTASAQEIASTYQPAHWGTLGITAYVVIDRRLFLEPSCSVFDSGGGCGIDGGYYVTKDFGILAGGSAKGTSNEVRFNSFGGDIGVSYWVVPRVELYGFYTLSGTHTPVQTFQGNTYGADTLEHSVSVHARFRLP